MKPWFKFNNAAGAGKKPAELTIYDEIGPWGVTAKDFNAQLKAVEADTIDVSINSIGGDVFAGLGIYNSLKQSGKTINVKVMGLAASIASIIAMAGDSIEMPANTFMMVHNPWSFAMGNADDLRDMAGTLDKIGASLTAIYVSRTGKSEDEIVALLKAETYMTADEALEHGFTDKVTDDVKVSAKFDLADLPANVKAIFMAAAKPPVKATKTDPEPTPDPVDPQAADFGVDQITAQAKAGGMEAYATAFALDASIDSPVKLTAAMKDAGEIKALCVLSGKTEQTDGFIKARKSKAEVRAALAKQLADEDAATHTSTVKKLAEQKAIADKAPSTAQSVYAKLNAPRNPKGK